MYVYILSDHDEHGSENQVATLDRSKLLSLVEKNWTLEGFDDWLAEAKTGLSEHLQRSDEELAALRAGWCCSKGWGGMQLHVVRLED